VTVFYTIYGTETLSNGKSFNCRPLVPESKHSPQLKPDIHVQSSFQSGSFNIQRNQITKPLVNSSLIPSVSGKTFTTPTSSSAWTALQPDNSRALPEKPK